MRKARRRLLHGTLTEASGQVARSPEKGCESHFGLLRVSEMEDWKAEFDRCFRAQRRAPRLPHHRKSGGNKQTGSLVTRIWMRVDSF